MSKYIAKIDELNAIVLSKNEQLNEMLNNGYYIVGHDFVHRMIAETFVENPENKPFVDHINANRTDNRACNLRWVTQTENNRNPLTRKHIAEAMRGKVLSEECKRKMSETRKGRSLSEEHKRKISEGTKGRIKTEEHRAKLSAAFKGRHVKIVDGKRIWYD